MTDYVKKTKSLVGSLAAVGKPISTQDLIDHTLIIWGHIYDPFVISVYLKLDGLSVQMFIVFINLTTLVVNVTVSLVVVFRNTAFTCPQRFDICY